MIYYFAGAESELFRKIVRMVGGKHILMSAYSLKYGKIPEDALKMNIIIDSGGYTLRKNNTTFDIKTYVNFLNRNEIKLAFNLDTNDFDETNRNQEVLDEETKTKIIPIYHYSDYRDNRDLIDTLVEEYDYIAIGGVAGGHLNRAKKKNFFNYVFKRTKDKVKVHGLGVNALKELEFYPFYSVDGTSWLSPARFRSMAKFDGRKTRSLSKTSSEISLDRMDMITATYQSILVKSAKNILEIENYITRLWAKRGIIWQTK